MLSGLILKESLSDLGLLDNLHITKTEVWQVTNAVAWQPSTWTAVSFEADEAQADQLAEQMSLALKPRWYINASTSGLVYVIFTGRVFKYPKGDGNKRLAVQDYARSVGVPESQLDWGE
jgi:hypothetical protein